MRTSGRTRAQSAKVDTRASDSPSAAERLGAAVVARRCRLEGKSQFGEGKKWLPLQALDPIMAAIRGLLDISGCYNRLAQKATDVSVEENTVFLRRLPEALDGLRILHLSDLHIDSTVGFGHRLADLCHDLVFDVAVLTGDFRMDIRGSFDAVLREMRPLAAVLGQRGLGAYAVLGNHDSFDMVEPLEDLGLRFLLNESVTLERNGARLHLAGVDDAHFFGTDDIDRALGGRDDDAPTVFLCHSPDLIDEAESHCADLYLCGHTHGGQICLPGGVPLLSNANCNRIQASGAWKQGALQGYTSRGTGFSGVPMRSFCTPEVTLHELQRERRNPCRTSQ